MSRFLAGVLSCLLLFGCKTVPVHEQALMQLPEAPPVYYLDTESQCQTRIHEFIEKNPEWNEQQKIRFLIDAIRSSQLQFLRNGSTYDGIMASRWMRWKMYHRQFRNAPILTGADFVARVATRSEKSRHPYEAVMPDGNIVALGEILQNELDALNKALMDRTLSNAIKEESIQNKPLSQETLTSPAFLPPPSPTA